MSGQPVSADDRVRQVQAEADHHVGRGWNLTDILQVQLVAELRRIGDALEASTEPTEDPVTAWEQGYSAGRRSAHGGPIMPNPYGQARA